MFEKLSSRSNTNFIFILENKNNWVSKSETKKLETKKDFFSNKWKNSESKKLKKKYFTDFSIYEILKFNNEQQLQ